MTSKAEYELIGRRKIANHGRRYAGFLLVCILFIGILLSMAVVSTIHSITGVIFQTMPYRFSLFISCGFLFLSVLFGSVLVYSLYLFKQVCKELEKQYKEYDEWLLSLMKQRG